MTAREIQFVRYALDQSLSHIRQYRRYSDEMRKSGRGFDPSAETSPTAIEFALIEAEKILANETNRCVQ